VFAHYFRGPVPRWADEGAAILSEGEVAEVRHQVQEMEAALRDKRPYLEKLRRRVDALEQERKRREADGSGD
jgi:hypothetical protein